MNVVKLVCMLCVALCTLAADPTPSPSPQAREQLNDAWWTGPLLAPAAGTLPRGHVLVEPYLYDVIQYGTYDRNGILRASSHSNSFGNLTYLIYGATDRLSVGALPTFGYTTTTNGTDSSGIGFGDIALQAQYRLALYHPGSWIPTTSINIQETFPTGRYDRLGDHPNDGFGSGVYTTTISLYTQTYFWTQSDRIVRARFNFSQAFSGATAVDGVSVYGTDAHFHGTAKPGNAFTFDGAAEYSVTRNWVLAFDLVYHTAGNSQVRGTTMTHDLGSSRSWAIAPAIEYNWSPNVGIIAGVRAFPSGFNTSATVTPAIAVNIVH